MKGRSCPFFPNPHKRQPDTLPSLRGTSVRGVRAEPEGWGGAALWLESHWGSIESGHILLTTSKLVGWAGYLPCSDSVSPLAEWRLWLCVVV